MLVEASDFGPKKQVFDTRMAGRAEDDGMRFDKAMSHIPIKRTAGDSEEIAHLDGGHVVRGDFCKHFMTR